MAVMQIEICLLTSHSGGIEFIGNKSPEEGPVVSTDSRILK
jgi:hypothetical protein